MRSCNLFIRIMTNGPVSMHCFVHAVASCTILHCFASGRGSQVFRQRWIQADDTYKAPHTLGILKNYVRDVPYCAVPGSGGSVPCQRFPSRAMPCPYDPCRAKYLRGVPCQDLGTKKVSLRGGEKKNHEGAQGAAGPRQGVWVASSPPRIWKGVWGRQPPSKNNLRQ